MDHRVYWKVCVEQGHRYQGVETSTHVYLICTACGHDLNRISDALPTSAEDKPEEK